MRRTDFCIKAGSPLPSLALSVPSATFSGSHGVDRHRFHSGSGPVWPLLGTLRRGQLRWLSAVPLWHGGGDIPGALGSGFSSARAPAAPRFRLQGVQESARCEASSAWPSARPFPEWRVSWFSSPACFALLGGLPPALLGSGNGMVSVKVRPTAQSCGACRIPPPNLARPSGLSPRPRGLQVVAGGIAKGLRSIPAWAGSASCGPGPGRNIWVYPDLPRSRAGTMSPRP